MVRGGRPQYLEEGIKGGYQGRVGTSWAREGVGDPAGGTQEVLPGPSESSGLAVWCSIGVQPWGEFRGSQQGEPAPQSWMDDRWRLQASGRLDGCCGCRDGRDGVSAGPPGLPHVIEAGWADPQVVRRWGLDGGPLRSPDAAPVRPGRRLGKCGAPGRTRPQIPKAVPGRIRR